MLEHFGDVELCWSIRADHDEMRHKDKAPGNGRDDIKADFKSEIT